MRRLGLVILALLTVGCAPAVLEMHVSPSDVGIAEAALEGGAAQIHGSALIRQRGGGVVTCAGNEVYLIPHTESTERAVRDVFGGDHGYVERGGSVNFGGGQVVSPPEPHRTAVCDAQGFYRFGDVRAGNWYVMTVITWTVGENYQGGAVLGFTRVGPGQEQEVVLTH